MDSFEVENFRSLKHLKLEKLARVNLLVGKNNSGKTSVLEAIWALRGIRSGEWLAGIEAEREQEDDSKDFRHLFYQFNGTKSIQLKIEYEHREKSAPFVSAKFSLVQSQSMERLREFVPRRSIVNAMQVELAFSNQKKIQSVTFELHRGENKKLLFVPISENAKQILDRPLPLQRNYGTEFISTSLDRSLLSQKIEWLKVNKREDMLLSVLQQAEPRILRIELVSSGQVYLDLGKDFANLLPLNLMGEGFQRLLDVMAALAQMRDGVVLIDEIDNGLHYSALRILWKGILQAARDYDVQVFASTHSAEALRHLTWVLDEFKDYRDDVAAYTLIRTKEDEIRSFRYNYEQLEFAMENDIEVRN